MAAIIKQNFTLAYVRVLIASILEQGEFKIAKSDSNSLQTDLRSTLLGFASTVWQEAHKTSMI